MAFPTDYKYTKEHEWIKADGKNASVGITSHAQESLGDIVFVDLPKPGVQWQLRFIGPVTVPSPPPVPTRFT